MTSATQPAGINRLELVTYGVLWTAALVWSLGGPSDGITLFLEVLPVLIVMPLMIVTRNSFPLTPLLYRLAFIHGLVLILGGYYTYAEVPLGFWIQDWFDLTRNNYDRIGHFFQGFVPAILAREILLRKTALQRGKLMFYIVVSICLAFSAFYEIIEWWAAAALGMGAEDFLGMQGDEWDAQWDMCMAMVGAILAQLLLGRAHDRALARLGCA